MYVYDDFKACAPVSLRKKWKLAVGVGIAISALQSLIAFLIVSLLFAYIPNLTLLFEKYTWVGLIENFPLKCLMALFLLSLVSGTFGGSFLSGYLYMILKICRGEKASPKDIFYPLFHRFHRFFPAAALDFWLVFSAFIPCLLFSMMRYIDVSHRSLYSLLSLSYLVIGAVLITVIFCGLSMAPLLLLDDTSLNTFQALSLSWAMMRENKGRYFVLNAPLIGCFCFLSALRYVSAILSMIGRAFLTPYFFAISIYFYFDLPKRLGEAFLKNKKERQAEDSNEELSEV